MIEPLGFPWACQDPFLFCAYHKDAYPAGNNALGPQAALAGRQLGQDFDNRQGWNMYHGRVVPGFPQHPHRGFETLTIVRQGLVDHSDSLGAAARYGEGDAQWLTTGAGISHSEMFPLLRQDAPNPLEAFQIWINLAPAKKMSPPRYSIVWDTTQPRSSFGAKGGAQVHLKVVAGNLAGLQAPAPPPDSWASEPGADLAVALIDMDAASAWTLPACAPGVDRALYVYQGGGLNVAGNVVPAASRVLLPAGTETTLLASEACRLLLLQGRPIGAPVANYGPFVMNTPEQLEQAFDDYRTTHFGGWPWPSEAPTHPATQGRFARFADGTEQKPPAL